MKKTMLSMALVLMLVGFAGGARAAEPVPPPPVLAPSGLCLQPDGTLLLADEFSKALWSQRDGVLTRLTGESDLLGADGLPLGGYRDGEAKKALFASPWAIAPYGDGYAITDTENQRLRFWDGTAVSTLAGNTRRHMVNGRGIVASFCRPTGLAADGQGNLYIADTGNHVIRKMDAAGNVTTYAGSKPGRRDGALGEAQLREPTGLCFADGVLYVADSGNHRIVRIADGRVETLAGLPQPPDSDGFYQGGFAEGAAQKAQFASPQGVAAAGDCVYVADTGNGAIRKIQGGLVTTLCRRTTADARYPVSPRGLLVSGDSLLVGDLFARQLFSVDRKTVPEAVPAPETKPTPVPETKPEKPPRQSSYVVRSGDTLSKIAADHGCTVAELVTLNRIPDQNRIFTGQRLRLPAVA